MIKKIILIILLVKTVEAVDVTVPIKLINEPSEKTYSIHSDNYIYLNSNSETILGDILKNQTSFNAVRSGPKGQQTSVFTRGTNSNHTLVAINGSSIEDHSTSNGLTDVSNINVNFANIAHLIKGPMSTLHGPNAVGGVIDLQTSQNYKNNLILKYGSNNTRITRANLLVDENKKLNLGYHFEATDGISIYPKGEEKDSFSSSGFNLNYYDSILSNDIELLYIQNTNKSDLDGSGADDLDYTNKIYFNFYQLIAKNNSSIGNLILTFDNSNWERKYYNGSETDSYNSSANRIKLLNKFKINRIKNSMGIQKESYDVDFDNQGSYNSSVNKDAEQTAIFYNSDFNFTDEFFFSGGIRYDDNSRHGNQSTYRLGSEIKLSERSYFLSVASGFKNPTMYEMFGADNFGYSGNPNLKTEESINKEIGINHKGKIVDFKFTIFDNEISNLIKYENSTYVNASGSSTMQGFEIDNNINFKDLSIINSYSHVHAVDSSNVWLKRRPHDIFNTSLIYNLNDILIKPSIEYYGSHTDTHSTNFSTILIKERTLFNLDLDYKNFNISINNIFNDQYERPHGYNQGARQSFISFNYDYSF